MTTDKSTKYVGSNICTKKLTKLVCANCVDIFLNCQTTGVVLRKLFPIFAQFVVAVTSPTNEEKFKN